MREGGSLIPILISVTTGPGWGETGDYTHCVQTSISDGQDMHRVWEWESVTGPSWSFDSSLSLGGAEGRDGEGRRPQLSVAVGVKLSPIFFSSV